MNSKQKEILSTHRNFLVKNIIWTEKLALLLKTNGVITESMLQDIEKSSKRDDKISRLLDLLPLRGSQVFEKFCDILQLSGHYFLSDFLRDEEGSNEKTETDIFKRLPFLGKVLKDTEKKQLELYITEKIHSELTKYVWKKDAKEKDKWLDLKVSQIEDSYQFEEERKTKNETLAKMEEETKSVQEECITLRAEVKALENAINQMQIKHKEDLAIQMRFNMANDNTIQKSNEKVESLERMLRTVHNKVSDRVKPAPRHLRKPGNSVCIEFIYLLDDFEVLLKEFDRLLEVQKTFEKLVEDCKWILVDMGFNNDNPNHSNLLNAYKQYAAQNAEFIQSLRDEIKKYKELAAESRSAKETGAEVTKNDKREVGRNLTIEDQNKWAAGTSVWQAAIMNVMRKQLQDVKLEIRKKESRIAFQDEDIKKLRSKIKQYEKRYARDKDKEKEREKEKEPEVQKEKDEKDTKEFPKIPMKKQSEKISQDTASGRISGSTSSPVGVEGMKGKLLPPLRFGFISKVNVSPPPKPLAVRQLQASIPRQLGPLSFQHDTPFPEGLSTSQIKFETRYKNNMADGVGGLKTIHKRQESSKVVLDQSHEKDSLTGALRKDAKVL